MGSKNNTRNRCPPPASAHQCRQRAFLSRGKKCPGGQSLGCLRAGGRDSLGPRGRASQCPRNTCPSRAPRALRQPLHTHLAWLLWLLNPSTTQLFMWPCDTSPTHPCTQLQWQPARPHPYWGGLSLCAQCQGAARQAPSATCCHMQPQWLSHVEPGKVRN